MALQRLFALLGLAVALVVAGNIEVDDLASSIALAEEACEGGDDSTECSVELRQLRARQARGAAIAADGRDAAVLDALAVKVSPSRAVEAATGTYGVADSAAATPDRPTYDAVKVSMPWESGRRPLVACPHNSHDEQTGTGAAAPKGGPDANLQRSLGIFCAAGLGALAEFYLDPRFEANDQRVRGADGWIARAFVTYMDARTPKSDTTGEEDMLVQSIHHFSDKPVVVVNFGDRVPTSLTPGRFPNLVLLHAKGAQTIGQPFNFNKLTAMLFSKVQTGIVLDADQFANRGVDSMFERAEEETTKEYPYPILPVHWMSRDPDSSDMTPPKGYPYAWHFVSKQAPKQGVRWGHAHPTWTHHALPWLANWTSFALAPQRTSAPKWLKEQGHLEDEDLLNVGLWSDGATKQWCKFDIPSPNDFDNYIKQLSPSRHLFADSKYYPKGIALMFFSAHDAKRPEESFKTLLALWDGGEARRPIAYNGKWFSSGRALREYDPSLACMA